MQDLRDFRVRGRDSSGNTAIWFMNGAAIASTGGLGNMPATWTIQSANAE